MSNFFIYNSLLLLLLFICQISELDLFDSYRFWLIIKPEMMKSKRRIEDILGGLNLGVNTNMVLGKEERRVSTADGAVTNNVTRLRRELTGDPTITFRLLQIYKASKTENETLNVDLGYWDTPNELYKIKKIINEEQRLNLGGYKFHVGIKNGHDSSPSSPSSPSSNFFNNFPIDGKAYEEKTFMELFDCLIFGINAR